MSFNPVVPFNGLQGWQFLNRTLPKQMEAFSSSAESVRSKEYFLERIQKITTADQLVDDPQVLRFALTAFGLEDDMQNKFLIKKVLDDGTINPDALSNKFSDKRYFDMAKSFGFGQGEVLKTSNQDFASEIVDLYTQKSFEAAVGERDESMRLAISLEAGISKVLASSQTDTSRWLAVLGDPPLKKVFETALRMPEGGGQAGLDDQINFLKDRSSSILGVESFDNFEDKIFIDKLRQNFLLMEQVSAGSFSDSGSIALTLLRNI